MCFYFCLYFLCFYEYIHRVCVYKWAYCWVKKKITYLPTLFFSSPLCQYNNNKKFGLREQYLELLCWSARLGGTLTTSQIHQAELAFRHRSRPKVGTLDDDTDDEMRPGTLRIHFYKQINEEMVVKSSAVRWRQFIECSLPQLDLDENITS